MKCPKCGRYIGEDPDDSLHYICDNCDLFYCRDPTCHCCEGLDDDL
jgi:hypothetical protein